MNQHECPICESKSVFKVANLALQDLFDGYRESEKILIDIRYLFKNTADLTLLSCQNCTFGWFPDAPVADPDFYETIQKFDYYYKDEKAEFEFASTFIEPNTDVLEVGCGAGKFASYLPKSVRYKGIEYHQAAVNKAKQAGLNVELKSLESLVQAEPQFYDVVYHFQVLEHIAEPLQFLENCVSLLKPGGKLIVAVPAQNGYVSYAESDWLNMPPHRLSRWTDKALAQAYQRVGVELLEIWHETRSGENLGWQEHVIVTTGWMSLFGKKPNLVSKGHFLKKLMYKFLAIPGARNYLIERALKRHPELENGHSVCVVGIKK